MNGCCDLYHQTRQPDRFIGSFHSSNIVLDFYTYMYMYISFLGKCKEMKLLKGSFII